MDETLNLVKGFEKNQVYFGQLRQIVKNKLFRNFAENDKLFMAGLTLMSVFYLNEAY